MLGLWVLEADLQEDSEALVYGADYLVLIEFVADDSTLLRDALSKGIIVSTFCLEDLFPSPPIDHLEPFHEEDA